MIIKNTYGQTKTFGAEVPLFGMFNVEKNQSKKIVNVTITFTKENLVAFDKVLRTQARVVKVHASRNDAAEYLRGVKKAGFRLYNSKSTKILDERI